MARLSFLSIRKVLLDKNRKKKKKKIIAIHENFFPCKWSVFDFRESFLREIRPKNYYLETFLSKVSWFFDQAKVSADESFCP